MVENQKYKSKSEAVVESLVIVILSLLFGFRPQTVVKLDLADFDMSEHELKFTEACRKGYSTKNVPLRRVSYPFDNFPTLRDLLVLY